MILHWTHISYYIHIYIHTSVELSIHVYGYTLYVMYSMYNIYRYIFLGIGRCWEIDKPGKNHSNMNKMNHHYKITLQPQGMSEFGNMCLFWTLLGTQSFGATLRILNSPSLGLAFCREKLLRFMMCIQEPILWCLGDPSGDGLLGRSFMRGYGGQIFGQGGEDGSVSQGSSYL